MAQVKLHILHDSIVEMVLNSANPAMPISRIIKELEEIKNKTYIGQDDARKMEHLAVQLVRTSRDIMVHT